MRVLFRATQVNLTASITASSSQNTLAAVQTTITPSGGTSYTYAGSLAKPTGSSAALDDATIANPTFTPDEAGVYTVTLTATDTASGATVTKVRTQEVGAAALSVSIASVANQLAATGVITCDSTVSNGLGALTYAWTGKKPDGTAITFSSDTAADPTVTLVDTDLPGTYSATVTVTDAARAQTASATVTWRVGDDDGWVRVWDSGDLTAQATTTISGGALTVGDKSFTVLNSGSASTFQITNGTGLAITATSGSLALASLTCPALYILLSSLWASYDATTHDLIVVLEVGSESCTNASDAYGLAISAPGANRIGSAGSSDRGVALTRIYSSGLKMQVGWFTAGSPSINNSLAAQTSTVKALRLRRFGRNGFRCMYTLTAADAADLDAASWTVFGLGQYGVEDGSQVLVGAGDELVIFASTTAAVVFTRITVYARRNN